MSEPIIRRALGPAFDRLHSRLREQYGVTSSSACAFVGRGVMEEVWHGRWYTLPFLHIAAKRSGMFPETGAAVPFTIANYAYVDGLGRETITWSRTFDFPGGVLRRFDETIVYSERRRCPVVYMGTHQHLAVELRTSVDDIGGLVITTAAQRMYEWRLGFRFPLILSGVAIAREWWSEQEGRFRVDVEIANPIWGRIFGYRGWFTGAVESCDEVPQIARPRREERRD